jgi:uncharacterized protein YqgC (DUF456 family)
MSVMAPKAAVYQERYQWSRRTASVVAAGVLAVLTGIGVAMPLLPTLLLLAAGVLALLWGAATPARWSSTWAWNVVAAFAPDVWVLDCDTGQRVTGDSDAGAQ